MPHREYHPRIRRLWAKISACLVVGSMVAACGTVGMLGLPLPAEGRPADEDRLIRLYQGLAPATVFLTSTYARNPQVSQWPTGVGSGFILDQEGTVLTSAHVVDNAATIMATLHDGQRVKAELIGSDSYTDLAVVRLIDFKGKLPTVQLGDSDRLQIGQRALVVGNAFGLGFTLSSGVISGMRQLQPSIDPVVPWMIQTTAPINPGNSGGPLVDYDGRVIGVARSILRGAQNIGFATPINTAKDVLRELKTNGRMVRPWLGVSGLFITQDIVDLFAMPMTVGILVVDVEHGSPADQAGLMAGNLHVAIEGNPLVLGGDIITSLNGQPISSPETFVQGVRSLRLGEPLDIRFHRLGQAHKVQAKVTERPSESMGVAKLPDEEVVSAPQRTSSRADGLDRYIDF